SITVDGDTSTNDMVLAMASGHAGHETLTPNDKDWSIFIELLQKTCEDLAKMIARDGEGATTLIEVEVNHAKTSQEAIQIAKSIVGSSLVKDRKSTRLNSSHVSISYAGFCLKKKKNKN